MLARLAAMALLSARVVLPAAEPTEPVKAAAGVKEVIGHMGSCGDRPGNTLASIRRAIEAKAHVAEVDVRTTKDGVLVYMIFSRRGYFKTFLGEKEEKGPALGERGRVGSPLPEHMDNFLDSVRSRKATKTVAEVAHLSCGLIHLGEIAYRTGRVQKFAPKAERFVGDNDANSLLTKEYRKPWEV